MTDPLLSPEIRQEILDNMTRTCILWTEDLMKGYFADPTSTIAQQMVLEAYAEAITQIAKRMPNRTAALKTFALELQDRITKES
jgi:hypothetical protein